MRRSTLVHALLALPLLAAAAGCRPAERPVATLTASPAELELAWPRFVELEVRLRATAELLDVVDRPLVFLHLLDEPGSVVRTFDHPLLDDWEIGREYVYSVRLYQSALADPLPPGDYLLSLGLYDPDLGRFALDTEGREVGRMEYQIGTVRVPPLAESDPRARFSEGWLAAEPGVDRQVLSRRALRGDAVGTVQLGPLEGAGTIYVSLDLPREGPLAGRRVEILDGASRARVVFDSCGGEQVEVTGSGVLEVDLAVPEATATCEIVVRPNFRVDHPDTAETTSVRLGVLAWSADAAAGR